MDFGKAGSHASFKARSSRSSTLSSFAVLCRYLKSSAVGLHHEQAQYIPPLAFGDLSAQAIPFQLGKHGIFGGRYYSLDYRFSKTEVTLAVTTMGSVSMVEFPIHFASQLLPQQEPCQPSAQLALAGLRVTPAQPAESQGFGRG